MRILVCGGRDFKDEYLVWQTLEQYYWEYRPEIFIIEGGAKGVDTFAHNFAESHGLERRTFNADWKRFGKAAGYRRNKQMLEEGKPDLVIAFPGGKGTAMMINLAEAAGVKVERIGHINNT